MSEARRLMPQQLVRRCDVSSLAFGSTAELLPLTEPLGQERALDAMRFGIRMPHDGYNLYMLGSERLGMLPLARDMLETEAASRPAPDDFCYVNNFGDPQKPGLLRVPPGRAKPLREEMLQLVEDLLVALPSAFQTDEYRNRVQEVEEGFKDRHEKAFNELGERARKQNVAIMGTPSGYTLAPVKNNELLSPEDYEKLPDEERKSIDATLEILRKELRDIVQQIPNWQRERRNQLKQLRDEVSMATVGQTFDALLKHYDDLPQVQVYLEAMRSDVIDNVELFFNGEGAPGDQRSLKKSAENLTEYSINLLVDNSDTRGAPIVYEDNPTYQDLIGRVEHVAQMGALITDFTLIKPGALHRANGGYLILDMRKLLMNAFAWDGLKRALASRELRIQSLEQMLSLASTLSLEPEPIPLNVKVVLLGDRLLHYLLNAYDPEFGLMFKVTADFAEDLPRSDDSALLYARMIAGLQQRDDLRPLNRDAVGAVIEECSRLASDSIKVSLDVESLGDLLREADFCAAERQQSQVERADVMCAIERQAYRQGEIRERVLESMVRDIHLVDTHGTATGQINGLSVLQLGDFSFGRPSRITATVRLGVGKVIDIEREAKLGGGLHSKGVMILSACLANRYARERPLPIAASLVFEQSYGMIDGDSASTAELCVLLSALASLPLRQDLAITGSVNQHGQVQAIGGVNEKIEGFFDLCDARGLSGDQGVIIPAANIDHLMLRQRVVDAVTEGRFAVYAVSTLDEAMSLLSGMPAGEMDADGRYSEGSFNRAVQERVDALWMLHRRFRSSEEEKADGDEESPAAD